MKKLSMMFCLVAVLGLVSGCTANTRARKFGGTSTTTLPKGQKLITATWKESNLWVLTRPMYTNEVAETFTFEEKSSLGLVQGKIIFQEQK